MIIRGDGREIPLRDGCVQTCVTSPPYWGLRDYSVKGQIGLERTPEEYVATMVAVFREVRRVLKADGTVWLNLGDSYASQGGFRDYGSYDQSTGRGFNSGRRCEGAGLKPKDLCGMPWRVAFALQADGWWLRSDIIWAKPAPMPESVQGSHWKRHQEEQPDSDDLVDCPGCSKCDNGWILCMSAGRPTRSHEYVFLLSKSDRYFYDSDAIREEAAESSLARIQQPNFANQTGGPKDYRNGVNPSRSMRKTLENFALNPGRNKRDVWTVNSEPTPEAHFAVFPQKLIEPCILAGTSAKGECSKCGANWVRETNVSYGPSTDHHYRPQPNKGHHGAFGERAANLLRDGFISGRPKIVETTGWRPTCSCTDAPVRPNLVLDPFLGSGTVGKVCERLGRRWVGVELSAEYIEIARRRTAQRGLFAAT